MDRTVGSGEVLEAADKLPLGDQEALMEVLQHRIIERRREELAKDIEQARREFQAGQCRPKTPSELMDELVS